MPIKIFMLRAYYFTFGFINQRMLITRIKGLLCLRKRDRWALLGFQAIFSQLWFDVAEKEPPSTVSKEQNRI